MRYRLLALCSLLLPLVASCQATAPSVAPPDPSELVLTGPLDRFELEAALPAWVEAMAVASIDATAAQELAMVPPGARVSIFLGTWCSDSRREISNLWRALDENLGEVPFEIDYHGVDRETLRSSERVQGVDLEFVPTLVVERAGEEVGRIVESSPHGTERDLLALLNGEVSGVVSGRPELAGED